MASPQSRTQRRGIPAKAKGAAAQPDNTVAPADKVEAPKKEKKFKVVRDSFTMPRSDYSKIAELKKRALKAGLIVKKSELLRAGLHVLSQLAEETLLQEIANLENVKTGRPAKHELSRKPKSGKKQK
jgi:hypothetical protein